MLSRAKLSLVTVVMLMILNYIMKGLVICTPYRILCGCKIEKNEMGRACGAYGAGESGVQGSGGET